MQVIKHRNAAAQKGIASRGSSLQPDHCPHTSVTLEKGLLGQPGTCWTDYTMHLRVLSISCTRSCDLRPNKQYGKSRQSAGGCLFTVYYRGATLVPPGDGFSGLNRRFREAICTPTWATLPWPGYERAVAYGFHAADIQNSNHAPLA